ncbi:hypothetical protein EB118_11330 [bacterium]|nr:hypothetical protein [bacterium]
MEKTGVECITKVRPGPKPMFSEEERRLRQLESNKRYRQSIKGKLQKKKDDAKYFSTDKGKKARSIANSKHRKTDKSKQTYRRYWQSEKGRMLLKLYWQSEKGKAVSRSLAAHRRKLIRNQKIKDLFFDEIKLWYMGCPQGHEVDHIIPITHELLCGLHVPWNFQYLTISSNRSKGNKL